MELFSQVTSNVGNNDGVWYNAYQGISRTHEALNALNRVDESEYPEKQVRLAEMRFLPDAPVFQGTPIRRSEEHTSELQSRGHLVCRLLLEKKKKEYKPSDEVRLLIL